MSLLECRDFAMALMVTCCFIRSLCSSFEKGWVCGLHHALLIVSLISCLLTRSDRRWGFLTYLTADKPKKKEALCRLTSGNFN